MKEFKYVITDEMGIHARPAGLLVKAVKGFGSSVKMTKGAKTVDCKGIMGVMSLGAKLCRKICRYNEPADGMRSLCELMSRKIVTKNKRYYSRAMSFT